MFPWFRFSTEIWAASKLRKTLLDTTQREKLNQDKNAICFIFNLYAALLANVPAYHLPSQKIKIN